MGNLLSYFRKDLSDVNNIKKNVIKVVQSKFEKVDILVVNSGGPKPGAFFDFSEDLIGALIFYGRPINGIDEDVRLTKRLYLPKKKLRGFDTYRIGPKDGDDYIGGNYTAAVTAEAQLPNILPESY